MKLKILLIQFLYTKCGPKSPADYERRCAKDDLLEKINKKYNDWRRKEDGGGFYVIISKAIWRAKM